MMTYQQYIWAILAASALLFPPTLKAEIYSLDFSTDGSLQSVFQSGLRPYRQQGFEKDKCEVRNSEIGVLLPGDVSLPSMKCEWAEFFVYKNDLLGVAEFRTGNLSIDEARNALDPFLQISSGNFHSKMESTFKVVAKDPLGFESEFSAGVNGNPSWIVFIRKSYNERLPIKVGLKIDWKRPRKNAVFRDALIEPPVGFEDISMDAPATHDSSLGAGHSQNMEESTKSYFPSVEVQSKIEAIQSRIQALQQKSRSEESEKKIGAESERNLSDKAFARENYVFPVESDTTGLIYSIHELIESGGASVVLPLLKMSNNGSDYRPTEVILRSALSFNGYKRSDLSALIDVFLYVDSLQEPVIIRSRNVVTPQIAISKISDVLRNLFGENVEMPSVLSAVNKREWLREFLAKAQRGETSLDIKDEIRKSLFKINQYRE